MAYKLTTKDGKLTSYALACGYVATTKSGCSIEWLHNCYVVTIPHDGQYYFDTLKEARKKANNI